jgi:hypothetical protein
MALYSYVCGHCGKYRLAADGPCPCRDSHYQAECPVQVMTFKPYTETDARDKPHFETRQQRDAYLAKNGLTYDTANYGVPDPRKPLMDDKLEREIMERAQNSPEVRLPKMTQQELNTPTRQVELPE